MPPSPARAQTFAVSPSKVHIDGLRPGTTASFELTVHNRHDGPRTFSLATCKPWDLTEGCCELPDSARVDFSPARLAIPAGGSDEVAVTVSIPRGEQWAHGDWETWLGITPAERGFLVVNCYVRLLVSTRGSPPTSVNYPLIIVLVLSIAVIVSGWRLFVGPRRRSSGK